MTSFVWERYALCRCYLECLMKVEVCSLTTSKVVTWRKATSIAKQVVLSTSIKNPDQWRIWRVMMAGIASLPPGADEFLWAILFYGLLHNGSITTSNFSYQFSKWLQLLGTKFPSFRPWTPLGDFRLPTSVPPDSPPPHCANPKYATGTDPHICLAKSTSVSFTFTLARC